MTKDEALKLALEALTGNWTNETECEALHAKHMESITAIKEALAQPDVDRRSTESKETFDQQEPVAHAVIAGALFDFMGWLTSRKERIVLSSADNASPAVEVIIEFAKMRNLSLDGAKVQDWNTTPPSNSLNSIKSSNTLDAQRKPLTDEEIKRMAAKWFLSMYWPLCNTFARAIEAAHGIKE